MQIMFNYKAITMAKIKQLFLILALFLSFCLDIYAQGKRITVDFKNVQASVALRQIEKKSGLKMQYSIKDMNFPVTYGARDAEPVSVVKAIVEKRGFTVSTEGKYVTIHRQMDKKQLSGRMRKISGYVRDKEGDVLMGVPICIGESRVCTVTDADGYYIFDIPVEETPLKFSYVGMETAYITISKGEKDVRRDVVMQSGTQLEEVVVTGIFRKAKESYTGSVSTIDNDQLKMYKGQNVLQTLKNVDVSLNFGIDNLNGSNPNNLPQLNIRGNSSLPISVEEYNETNKNNPNTPLVILDGFEISLTKLMDYSDEEIESINILKDAAATAIYGSRGANGVIVVISKKPEAGKLKVNYEAGVQVAVPDLTSYHLLDAAGKLEVERLAGLYDSAPTMSDDRSMLYSEAYNKRLLKVLSGVNTDWLSKPLHLGVGSKYSLRLEGGSEEFRWAANASYNNIQGAMKGSARRTFNGSITLMYQLKNLIFRNYTSIGLNNSDESKYGSFDTYAQQQPYNSPYDSQGRLVRYFDPFYKNSERTQNPLYDAALNTFNKSGYEELSNNFSIEWNILPELTLRGKFGISKTDNTTDYFLPAEHSYFTTGAGRNEYGSDEGFLRRGLYRYSDGKSWEYNTNITLSYNKIFNEVHSLYAGLDWSMQEARSDFFSMALEGFANEDLNSRGDARQYADNILPSGDKDHYRQFGITGNVNYTYDNRYYIDLSYRMDGNSRYGSNKKYAPFYSVGMGWNVHHERFLKGNKLISNLRLKVSYGSTGSATGASATDAYSVYRYITDNKYMNWTGAQLQGWGNPDLTWQTTKEFNTGIEFGLLDQRIRGSFDVYSKKTNNLLSSMNIPGSMGFSSYYANIGEVKNFGFEAMLSAYLVRDARRDLNWMVTGQLTYNKNKISKLSDAIIKQNEAYLSDGSQADIQRLFFVGNPQNSIYAVRSLGIDPSTGKEIFLDKDGNIVRKWNASNKVFMGSAEPLYRGNASTMLQWKNWTLNVSLYYYWGGYAYNSTLRDKVEVTPQVIHDSNVDERVLTDRWYQVGDVTFFKAMSNNTTRASSRYVMKDNVLELQSVSLQYKLKGKVLQKFAKLNTIILGVNASDLVHWGTIRMERGTSYPYARTIQGSVKLLF